MLTLLRRLFWLGLIAGAAFAVWTAWQRRAEPTLASSPQWPPFEPSSATRVDPIADTASPAGEEIPAETTATSGPATSTTATGAARWVAPIDGRCPDGYPIKANENSGIYHVPGGRFYERTVPERCYSSAEDAQADGYRRAKA